MTGHPRRVDGGDRWPWRGALACFALAGALAIAIILLSGCSLKSQQIALGGLQAGDVVSTTVAESRGAVEANPFFRTNLGTRIALKSAVSVGVIIATSQLDRMGHPRIARTLLYTLNAVLSGVIVNNMHVARGPR